MKQPNPIHSKQPQMVQEYNSLFVRSQMSYKELTEAIGVRYECVHARRRGKQVVTKEALLALKMVVLEREAGRLVAQGKLGGGAKEDPLEDIM